MTTIMDRARELDIDIPEPVPPLAAYIPAVIAHKMIYVSGQIPMLNGKLQYEGRVGDTVDIETGRKAAELCFRNVLSAVHGLGVTMDDIDRVVRLAGHVMCTEDFREPHLVINGASELSQRFFGEAGRHSRAAVGAFVLPLGSTVELEAWIALK